jgi:hypothetical protein
MELFCLFRGEMLLEILSLDTPSYIHTQCNDDSNYVGDYVQGRRHGVGVYTFPNGDTYAGECTSVWFLAQVCIADAR